MYLGIRLRVDAKACQIAHDILRMRQQTSTLPKWLSRTGVGGTSKKIELIFAPADSIRDRMPQGCPGSTDGTQEVRVPFHYKAMGGHTLVGGTTGSGQNSNLRSDLHQGDPHARRCADHR